MCAIQINIDLLQITYPDFHFYELLDQHRLFDPTLLNECENLMVT